VRTPGSAWPAQDSAAPRRAGDTRGSDWPQTPDSGTGSAWPAHDSGDRAGPGSTQFARRGSGTVRSSRGRGTHAAPSGGGRTEGGSDWPNTGPSGTIRESRPPGGSWRGGDTRGGGGRARLPRTGETLGPYQILDVLGQGAMGRVYRAQDTAGRPVALKALIVEADDEEGFDRFLREGHAMAAIPPHPGVVRVHAAGDDKNIPYLVLELVEGESLEDLLRRQLLPLATALELTRRLAEALHHIHQHGVVHRDLKPANVLMRPDGAPLLADFGLARLLGSKSLTVSGDLLGTPLYMPPEQVTGQRSEIDAQSDVWSLGVICYQLVTGDVPFHGTSFAETAERILEEEPIPVHSLRDEAGPALSKIVEKALEKDKSDRYPDAQAFADALEEILDGRVTRTTSLGGMFTRRRRRKLGRIALAVFLVSVLFAGGAAFILSRAAQQRAQELARQLQKVEATAEVELGDPLTANAEAVERVSTRLQELQADDESEQFAARYAALDVLLARGRFACALETEDWKSAEAETQGHGSKGELSLRRALLNQRRGRALDLDSLRSVRDTEGRLGGAVKVLFARSLRTRDPDHALEYLQGVSSPAAKRERHAVQLMLAIDNDLGRTKEALREELPPEVLLEARARALSAVEVHVAAKEDLTSLMPALRILNELPTKSRNVEREAKLLKACMSLLGFLVESGPVVGTGSQRAPGSKAPTLDDAVEFFHELGRLKMARAGVILNLQPPRNLMHLLLKDVKGRITFGALAKVALGLINLDVPIPVQMFATAPFTSQEKRELLARQDPGVGLMFIQIDASQPGAKGERGRTKLLEFLGRDPWALDELGPRTRAQALSWAAFGLEIPQAKRQKAVEEAQRLDPDSHMVRMAQALTLAFGGQPKPAAEAAERVLVAYIAEQRSLNRSATYIPSYLSRCLIFIHAMCGDWDKAIVHLKTLSKRYSRLVADVQAHALEFHREAKRKAREEERKDKKD
jgi:hypothetical protein